MRHSAARQVPAYLSPVQYSSKKVLLAGPQMDTALSPLVGGQYAARRHSLACASSAFRAVVQHNNNNDAVFYEDDADFPLSMSHASGSTGSSPLMPHRKVERSHSEPKAPFAAALYRELPDDRLASTKNRYKTELCRAYLEAGHCKYGEKCQFAHGKHDLRVVNRHPKYKTERCRSFHTTGLCQYGARCHFIHDPSEASANQADDASSVSSANSTSNNNANRGRSVSLCVYPPQMVPQLYDQSYLMGSFNDSATGLSSYSASPVSASPGLNSSWNSEDCFFFGSSSNVNYDVPAPSGTYYDEQMGPWRTSLDQLLHDIDITK